MITFYPKMINTNVESVEG